MKRIKILLVLCAIFCNEVVADLVILEDVSICFSEGPSEKNTEIDHKDVEGDKEVDSDIVWGDILDFQFSCSLRESHPISETTVYSYLEVISPPPEFPT